MNAVGLRINIKPNRRSFSSYILLFFLSLLLLLLLQLCCFRILFFCVCAFAFIKGNKNGIDKTRNLTKQKGKTMDQHQSQMASERKSKSVKE